MPTSRDRHAAAVLLGRRGGLAKTEAQQLARSQNGARATGRKPKYRLTPEGLERREGERWHLLSHPLDAAALAYLRRQRH